MGCDISVLSRHNLDITNVETLAVELSRRLGYSIEYGYYAFEPYNDLLKNNLSEDFVALGIIKSNGRQFRLTDENYQEKLLHLKFGDAFFEMDAYLGGYNFKKHGAPTQLEIATQKNKLRVAEYFLNNYGTEQENGYLTIHNHIVSNDLHYYTRWWDFCKTIQLKDHFDDDYYKNYRLAVMHDTLALGGTKAYFVNDQCSHLEGVGEGEEMYLTWDDLEQHISGKIGDGLISISNSVLDLDYQQHIKLMEDSLVAFYDDFEDIK